MRKVIARMRFEVIYLTVCAFVGSWQEIHYLSIGLGRGSQYIR